VAVEGHLNTSRTLQEFYCSFYRAASIFVCCGGVVVPVLVCAQMA